MAYIDTDLQLVEETGRKIVDEIVEAQKLINEFYERITELPLTGEMHGNNAELYCKHIRSDKKTYINFTDKMKEVGEEMMRFANDADGEVRRNERDLGSSQ